MPVRIASSCKCSSVLARFSDFFFQQLLARSHDVAALLVQLDDADFDVLALQAVEIADRAKVDLGAGQERARAENVDRQAALDAVDDASLDGGLVVVGFLDLVPGVQALRLLVGEIDVALFGVALLAHDVDFVAGLDVDVAFVVLELGHRYDAFGLVADVDDDVLGVTFSTVPVTICSSFSAASVWACSCSNVSRAVAKSSMAGLFFGARGCGGRR